jgi:hypothetical protein
VSYVLRSARLLLGVDYGSFNCLKLFAHWEWAFRVCECFGFSGWGRWRLYSMRASVRVSHNDVSELVPLSCSHVHYTCQLHESLGCCLIWQLLVVCNR